MSQCSRHEPCPTSLNTDITDDMSTACDGQVSVITEGQEAGVAVDPGRHVEPWRMMMF